MDSSIALSFWTKTSGTWINVSTVLLGTVLGLLLRGKLPLAMQRVITQGLGLITLFLGISMGSSLNQVQAGPIPGVILGLLAIVCGGLLGEWWRIEEKLQIVGDWLKRRFRGGGSFTDGFVAASLLFCVGPMALIGSLNNGLTGDSTLLTIKATMDGLAAIALTSSFGIGVSFSTLSILIYQGSVSIAAALLTQSLPNPAASPQILLVSGVGGLMIMGLGLNLLEVAKIRTAAFLPALLLAPIAYTIAHGFK
ncbi:MAG TPA: DUF554 domain-containing protein [Thermosynechococcaceae cyanobacterium]